MYSANFYNAISTCPTIGDVAIASVQKFIKMDTVKSTCFDINYETGMITYLPIDKYKNNLNSDGFDPYNNSLRVGIKPGKFITQIYNAVGTYCNGVTTILFSEHIATLCTINKPTENSIKIVRGEDIRKAYLWKSHAKRSGGTLGKSCMRYTKTQCHLNLYADNDDLIELITLVTPEDKILARCLLWDGKYHDRVYYANEQSKHELRGFLYLKEYKDIYYDERKLVFQLKHWQYKKYPYMDTVKYLFTDGRIATDPSVVDKNYTFKTWRTLTSVNGYAY